MDAYIDHSFETYKGVPDLIDWCFRKNILFLWLQEGKFQDAETEYYGLL